MVFSSVEFILIFFVGILILYYLPFKKNHTYKNIVLFIFGIFFYAWGEKKAVFLLLFSIFINYLFGLAIANQKEGLLRRLTRDFAVIFNLSILIIFKYLGFILENIGNITGQTLFIKIALPIGISFYTFQILSYILDLYNGKIAVQKNLLRFGLYVSLFPQLVAGPIVRYATIEDEIEHRNESVDDFKKGFFRFIKGLSKKVLISNSVAMLADKAFAASSLSVVTAWLGAIAYTIQIYYDFSGYSDMAIGLGLVFGFHFDENFDYPYSAKSITEFWRKWHISLSSWFRDYIYIPLGGNRCSKLKTYRNLFIVWILTGIWHGANWTFILWGLIYFILLVIEKNINLDKIPSLVGRIYTMFVVMLCWVIFRAESVTAALKYIAEMFGIGSNAFIDDKAIAYLGTYKVFLLIGIIFAFPINNKIKNIININQSTEKIINSLIALILFICSLSFLVSGDYNPFIYFTF